MIENDRSLVRNVIFIFIARLRFSSGFPVVGVLLNRYSANHVRNVRKLDKIKHKHCQSQLDLDF